METETIYTFATKRFTLKVFASPDYDLDLSWDDDGSARAGLESGEFVAFTVCAAIYLDGREVASDFLGGCIYRNIEEFRDHIGIAAKGRADGHNYGSYFSDMVATVCREARKALANVPHLRATAL